MLNVHQYPNSKKILSGRRLILVSGTTFPGFLRKSKRFLVKRTFISRYGMTKVFGVVATSGSIPDFL